MKTKHTSKKQARRPFTGSISNRAYNWHTSTVDVDNMRKEERYLIPYSKLPKRTYKNL